MSTPSPLRHPAPRPLSFAHATRVPRIHQRRLIKTPVAVGGAADAGKREESAAAAPHRPQLRLKMANWEENVLKPPSAERRLMCARSEEQPSSPLISSSLDVPTF